MYLAQGAAAATAFVHAAARSVDFKGNRAVVLSEGAPCANAVCPLSPDIFPDPLLAVTLRRFCFNVASLQQ